MKGHLQQKHQEQKHDQVTGSEVDQRFCYRPGAKGAQWQMSGKMQGQPRKLRGTSAPGLSPDLGGRREEDYHYFRTGGRGDLLVTLGAGAGPNNGRVLLCACGIWEAHP